MSGNWRSAHNRKKPLNRNHLNSRPFSRTGIVCYSTQRTCTQVDLGAKRVGSSEAFVALCVRKADRLKPHHSGTYRLGASQYRITPLHLQKRDVILCFHSSWHVCEEGR